MYRMGLSPIEPEPAMIKSTSRDEASRRGDEQHRNIQKREVRGTANHAGHLPF